MDRPHTASEAVGSISKNEDDFCRALEEFAAVKILWRVDYVTSFRPKDVRVDAVGVVAISVKGSTSMAGKPMIVPDPSPSQAPLRHSCRKGKVLG